MKFEIHFYDLKEEVQIKFLKLFGKDAVMENNYDVFPIATMEVEQ